MEIRLLCQPPLGRGSVGRKWVLMENMHVYVRATKRYLEGVQKNTLEIGSVEVQNRGEGVFSRWLPEFEAQAKHFGRVVYVENVLDERFQQFWVRRGYRPVGNPPDSCYWKDFGEA